jgi:hypothetical protein
MAEATEETSKFVIKVGVYIVGTLLGLGAKLAAINYEKGLSMKAIIYHTMVAFACAWLVWFGLKQVGQEEFAMPAAVVVGRFGDTILIQLGKGIKKAILSFINIGK